MNTNKKLFNNIFYSVNTPQTLASDKKQNFKNFYENLSKKTEDFSPSPETLSLDNYIKIEKNSIISIDSRDRDINKHPYQNDFISFLGKTFFNVKKIELVSTEIPNTDQTIKEIPSELQNNIVAWTNEEDFDLNFFEDLRCYQENDMIYIVLENHGYTIGEEIEGVLYNSRLITDISPTGVVDSKRLLRVIDSNTFAFEFIEILLPVEGITSLDLGYPIYKISVKPGNYTAQTLADQIALEAGFVKRRNGTGQFHFFEVKVNFDTDVLFLDSVTTTQLPSNSISTLAGSNIITVNQKGHGFYSGDRVKMIGLKQVAGIPSSTLNGDFTVNVLDFNTFTYEVVVRASETTDGGGNTIRTGKNAPFRLLFDSQNTKIQFNTGFPDEDSSEKTNGFIAIKNLKVTNAEITGDFLRFTTSEPHELSKVSIFEITSIATGVDPIITTSTPHKIDVPRRITIRDTNSTPKIKGTYLAVPVGISTFKVKGIVVTSPGNTGEAIYGSDKIKVSGLQTVPSILIDPIYFVEEITSDVNFDIKFKASDIFLESLKDTTIGTSRIEVTHIDHNFNQLVGISQYPDYVMLKTLLPILESGKIRNLVETVDGPPGTNTVDLYIQNHNMKTSDSIAIIESDSDPVVNGSYNIQVVDQDTIRINFVHSSFVPGFSKVISGDSIVLSETNSLPKINGKWSLSNQYDITFINTGTFTSEITVNEDISGWAVGDIVDISLTNSDPPIDSRVIVNSLVNSNTFTIALETPVLNTGDTGKLVNRSSLKIYPDYTLISPGSFPAGVVGRDLFSTLYRVEPDVQRGDNVGGIKLSEINGKKRKIEKLKDKDTYVLRATEEYSTKAITNGGDNIMVSSDIHGLRSIQANTVDGNTTGKLFRSISLEGENYIYLVLDIYGYDCSVISNQKVSNAFAKIILTDAPGNMVFNSFISEPKVFESPVSKVDQIRLRFIDSRGFEFNFNDINYSLSLKVTELIDIQKNSNINSRSGNTQFDGLSTAFGNKEIKAKAEKSIKTGKLGASFGSSGQVRASSGRN